MSAAALPILCRWFLRGASGDRYRHPSEVNVRRYVVDSVSTSAAQLGELQMVFRKGWIEDYERHPFGWTIRITDKGRAELERVIADYAARDANQTQCDKETENAGR